MLIAFISLQGGRTHPWFSHCTPLCAAAQPQSPSNSQHGADEPPACRKASNPILPQRCRQQLAHRPAPSPARQDAAAHAGTAPISPSIRGNTWTRDRGKSRGSQGSWRSTEVQKAPLFPEQEHDEGFNLLMAHNYVKALPKHTGSCLAWPSAHQEAPWGWRHTPHRAKPSSATWHNLTGTSTSRRYFLFMPSLMIPPDLG